MSVYYGDYVLCSIDLAGDSDSYRLWGNEGDLMFIEMIRVEGESFEPWLWITSPSGETLINDGDYNSQDFSMTLTETGVYTINAREWDDRATGQYSMSFACNGGPCLPPPQGGGCDQNDDGAFRVNDVIEFWNSCKAQ